MPGIYGASIGAKSTRTCSGSGRPRLLDGGERGIRTLGAAFDSTHDFQSCSFSQLGHLSVRQPAPRPPGCIRPDGERVVLKTFPLSRRERAICSRWRRGWDSNPRSRFWRDTAFRERGLQPLGHLSATASRPAATRSGLVPFFTSAVNGLATGRPTPGASWEFLPARPHPRTRATFQPPAPSLRPGRPTRPPDPAHPALSACRSVR